MGKDMKTKISPKACADYIRQTAESSYGVVGMATPNGVTLFSQLFPGFFNRRSVEILSSEKGYKINIYIIAEYGTNFKQISKNLCDVLKYSLKEDFGIVTAGINVHIKGVRKSRS